DRDRPADRVTGPGEEQPDRGREGSAQGTESVGGDTEEQGGGLLGAEPAGDRRGGGDGHGPEPGEGEGVTRRPGDGPEDVGDEGVEAVGDPSDRSEPPLLVGAEAGGGSIDVTPQERGPAVFERMGELDRGLGERESLAVES